MGELLLLFSNSALLSHMGQFCAILDYVKYKICSNIMS